HWPYALPDLRSRLAALACEGLKAPDTELLAQLILRHGAARGFKLDAAACAYLADRIPRTCDATRAIVAAMEVVTRPSLKSSMALAQRALQHFYQSTAPEPDEDDSVARDLFDE
ncbi:MAG: Bacterial dnaA protein, partial [Pseudomonadota bacterium]